MPMVTLQWTPELAARKALMIASVAVQTELPFAPSEGHRLNIQACTFRGREIEVLADHYQFVVSDSDTNWAYGENPETVVTLELIKAESGQSHAEVCTALIRGYQWTAEQ